MFNWNPKGFIPVRQADIKVDEPLPYPIFDKDGRLLLGKDSIPVSDHQISLLKQGFTPNMDTDIGKQLSGSLSEKEDAMQADPISILDEVKSTIDRVSRFYYSSKAKEIDVARDIDLTRDITIATSRLVNNLSKFSSSWLLLATRYEELADYYKYLSLKAAIYTMVLGRNIFSQREDLIKLAIAALLHDIGDSRIPHEIRNKPSKLTEEEFAIVKKHPFFSVEIIKDLGITNERILAAILFHHEKLNGEGYYGKKGDEIPIESQIISISTSYNAMVSNRPSKAAIEPRDAIKALWEDSDKIYKKVCVEYLIKELGVYPIGSIVKLNTGKVGMVVKNNKSNPLTPIVWILLDKDGERKFNVIMNDLAQPDAVTGEQKIVSVLTPSALGFTPNVSRMLLSSKILY